MRMGDRHVIIATTPDAAACTPGRGFSSARAGARILPIEVNEMNLRYLAIRCVALAALAGVAASGCSNPPTTSGTRPQGSNAPPPVDKDKVKTMQPAP